MSEVLRPLLFLCTVGVFGVLLSISLGCLSLLGWVLWERRALAAREALISSLARSVVLGLADVLGSVLLVVLMANINGGLARLLSLVLILLAVSLTLIGLPGVTTTIGERVLALADRPASRAAAVWVGTATLCGAGLFPWVGQAVLLLALLAGLGSAVMGARRSL